MMKDKKTWEEWERKWQKALSQGVEENMRIFWTFLKMAREVGSCPSFDPCDLEDVRFIIRKQSVDVDYIRRWLMQFEKALNVSLLATLEKVLQEEKHVSGSCYL